jgi:hypothetical protein
MKKLILTLTVLLTLVSLNAQTYKYKIVSQTDSVETILTNGEVTIKFKNKYDEFGFQKATINIKTDSLTVKDVVWGIHYKSDSDDFVDISLENNKEYRIIMYGGVFGIFKNYKQIVYYNGVEIKNGGQ